MKIVKLKSKLRENEKFSQEKDKMYEESKKYGEMASTKIQILTNLVSIDLYSFGNLKFLYP